MALPKFLPVLILLLQIYQLHFIAYCFKKGISHFSHVIEDGLLGKYLFVTPIKDKIENSY